MVQVAVVVGAACGMAIAEASVQAPRPARGAQAPAAPQAPSEEKFLLHSKVFADGARIPDRFTVEGEDVSPPLKWSGAPAGTKSFAIICEDIDLRGGRPFAHWVIYGIAGDVTELPEALPRERELEKPIVAKQGTNSWRKDNTGYRGPATPPGEAPHRYRFTIYALKEVPDVRAGLNAEGLRHRIKELILAEATTVGTYSRARKPGETPPGVQEKELPTAPPQAPGAPPATPPSDPNAKPSKPETPPARQPRLPPPRGGG